MFKSDEKLGEVKRKRGQDYCTSRAAPFRGRLPVHERNNIKLFPVALDYLFLQPKNLDGGLSVLCSHLHGGGQPAGLMAQLCQPWHLWKAVSVAICGGPAAALGAVVNQPSG